MTEAIHDYKTFLYAYAQHREKTAHSQVMPKLFHEYNTFARMCLMPEKITAQYSLDS